MRVGILDKKILLACDHAGAEMASTLCAWLSSKGLDVEHVGAVPADGRVDSVLYADKVAPIVARGDAVGILICGTGVAMSIRANRYSGVRAALVWHEHVARACREHNDANILCLGARQLDTDTCKACVDVFLNTECLGGRYADRNAQLDWDLK